MQDFTEFMIAASVQDALKLDEKLLSDLQKLNLAYGNIVYTVRNVQEVIAKLNSELES